MWWNGATMATNITGPQGVTGVVGPTGPSTSTAHSGVTTINSQHSRVVFNGSNLTIASPNSGSITIGPSVSSSLAPQPGEMRWDTVSGDVMVYDGMQWRNSSVNIQPQATTVHKGLQNFGVARASVTLAPAETRPCLNYVVRAMNVNDAQGRATPRWADICNWLSFQNLRPDVDYQALRDTRFETDVLVLFQDETTAATFRMAWAGEPSQKELAE